MQFGAVTDIGMHRKINEDNYYVNESDTFPYAVVAWTEWGGHQARMSRKYDGCRYYRKPLRKKS